MAEAKSPRKDKFVASPVRLPPFATDDKHLYTTLPLIPESHEPVIIDSDYNFLVELTSDSKRPSFNAYETYEPVILNPNDDSFKAHNTYEPVIIYPDSVIEVSSDSSSIAHSGESFHEFVYCKEDHDAVTIRKIDVDLLQPEKYINDVIIDFYTKYQKHHMGSQKQRFHFFNCFFFRNLIDSKDRSKACAERNESMRILRWTKEVDIFKKDYIFVPINFSNHWSLIVICHPGEVAGYRDDEMEMASRVPCILHMDSSIGIHKDLKDLFQGYLLEEWKQRHGELAEDVKSKFLNLKFLDLQLPQQQNGFDCGIFLLHYVDLFVKQAPINFSPCKITESPKFLSNDWFQPEDVSHKRDHIRKLICELSRKYSRRLFS